nr:hypothetical protein [Saccharopolyspora erythraea]
MTHTSRTDGSAVREYTSTDCCGDSASGVRFHSSGTPAIDANATRVPACRRAA